MARSSLTRAAVPARPPRRKPRLLVDRSGDRFEREADRAADRVVMGASPRFRLSAVPVERVQRQDAPGAQGAPKSDEEKYAEAAKKVAQAFAKTPQGQAIIDGIASDPLVKRVTDAGEAFVGSTPGKIVTGATVVGAVAALAATHESLPIGIPDVPLEKVSPRLAGWTMQITWEGPVDRPTRAMVGFSFSGRSEKKRAAAKQPSPAERLRAGDDKLGAAVSDVPGSKEARDRAMQDEAVRAVVARHAGLGAPGAGTAGRRAGAAPLGPGFLPSSTPAEPARMPRPGDAVAAPAGGVPKDEEPVMRRADGARVDAAPGAQALVESALAAPGQPLDRTTRTAMESRFGFDFGDVRVHADGAAGESARAIGAVAYSAGRDIVFSSGAYAPSTPGGQWLLAHELAHVVQQGAADGARGDVAAPALRVQRRTAAPPRPDPLGAALRGDDDDARALTQSQGWNTLTLAPRDAATLLSHLLEGATWDDDERAGLRILRKMIAEDLLDETLEELAAARRFGQLLDDYDGSEYRQLLDLLSNNIKTAPVAVKLLDKFISMWWLSPREQRAVVVVIEHVPPSQRTAVLQGGKDRVEALRRHIDERGTAVAFERLLASEEFTRWQTLSGQLSNVFTIKAEASVGRGQRTRAEVDELLKKAAEDLAAELLEYRDRLKQAGDRPDALAKVNKEYMRRIDALVADKSREFDLELRYNLEFDRLLMDLRGNRVTYGRPWQARDLDVLDAALSKIPRDLVRNSGVRVIARATYDPADPTVAGLAQETIGRIQLRSSLPAGDDDARWFFFESTAHEIGHFAEGADQPKAGDAAPRHQSTGPRGISWRCPSGATSTGPRWPGRCPTSESATSSSRRSTPTTASIRRTRSSKGRTTGTAITCTGSRDTRARETTSAGATARSSSATTRRRIPRTTSPTPSATSSPDPTTSGSGRPRSTSSCWSG